MLVKGREFEELNFARYTDVQVRKAQWVKTHLEPFLKSIGTGVTRVTYHVLECEEEVIRVWYDQWSFKDAFVTGSSYLGIIHDLVNTDAL